MDPTRDADAHSETLTSDQRAAGPDAARGPVHKTADHHSCAADAPAVHCARQQTAVELGGNLCRIGAGRPTPEAESEVGEAQTRCHQRVNVHNKTCPTVTLEDAVLALLNAVFLYMSDPLGSGSGSGLFPLKNVFVFGRFSYSTAKCFR